MKISSKIIAGYGILIILMAGLLAYRAVCHPSHAVHQPGSLERKFPRQYRLAAAHARKRSGGGIRQENTSLSAIRNIVSALVEFQMEFETTLGVVAGQRAVG